MSTVLPILRDTAIVASCSSLQNVGTVGDAGKWVKSPQ
jgi:hypothetical protein